MPGGPGFPHEHEAGLPAARALTRPLPEERLDFRARPERAHDPGDEIHEDDRSRNELTQAFEGGPPIECPHNVRRRRMAISAPPIEVRTSRQDARGLHADFTSRS